MYFNGFYDEFGASDVMKDQANAICTNRDENLKRAGIMMKSGYKTIEKATANLHLELGKEDKFTAYYESVQGREEEPYRLPIDYYKDRNHGKAVEIANLAIQKCKKDQAPFFLFLLQDAKEKGDEALFKKLMQSAPRRKLVNSTEVDAMYSHDACCGVLPMCAYFHLLHETNLFSSTLPNQ